MGNAVSRVVALANPFASDADVPAGEVDVVVDAEQTQRTMNIGSFFGTHFLMGGERYDTPKPDTFLFGDNSDLELLGSKPVQVINDAFVCLISKTPFSFRTTSEASQTP